MCVFINVITHFYHVHSNIQLFSKITLVIPAFEHESIQISCYFITSQNVILFDRMDTKLPQHINNFLEYLEIEKNCSKLTIRDYRHYLDVFYQWFSSTL